MKKEINNSLPGLLGISQEESERIIGIVAARLKAAILEGETPQEIKVITARKTLLQIGEASPEVILYIGLTIGQAYNAAVLASKKVEIKRWNK